MAEFERAKIIERMMRRNLHRLQKGEMIGGLTPFGYEMSLDTPATLAPDPNSHCNMNVAMQNS